MKRIPTFVAGMLTAAVIGGLGVGALAASGAVTFNASNLMFNGQQISAKGEGYTLDNGCQAPASITYTDEKGGGTTYLPVRRISELLDVETGWDGATGSVTVGKAADTTAIPADYSDWSEEEEAAYQEFKGMWEITETKATLKEPMNRDALQVQFAQHPIWSEYAVRLALESCSSEVRTDGNLWYGFHGGVSTDRYAAYVGGPAWATRIFSLTA